MAKGTTLRLGEAHGISYVARKVWQHRAIYSLLLPGLIWYIVFAYMPLGGLSLAFRKYKANMGIWGSPWVGLENYRYVVRDPAFWKSIWKTLYINAGRMLFQFPAPIIMALLLNEFRMNRYKRVLQTVFTFPHFLSWVVVASVMTNVLALKGIVNNMITALGGTAYPFFGAPNTFVPLMYATDIWKYAGYGSIIYLAAISGIDQEQYEAADIDGASRWQKLVHVTLPSILPTIVIMFILACGNMMSMGFDQIFNMSNSVVRNSVEVLDMYIYRITFESSTDFSFSAAVSLFRSVTNCLFLVAANALSMKLGGGGLLS